MVEKIVEPKRRRGLTLFFCHSLTVHVVIIKEFVKKQVNEVISKDFLSKILISFVFLRILHTFIY